MTSDSQLEKPVTVTAGDQKTEWDTLADPPKDEEVDPREVRLQEEFANYRQKKEESLERFRERATIKQKELSETPREIDGKENRAYLRKQMALRRAEHVLAEAEEEFKLLRCPTPEMEDYQMRQLKTFTGRVQESLRKDSQLCFHGTRLIRAQEIIRSKGLSSSVDRLGYQTSYDTDGQVSVSTRDSLNISVDGYMDMSEINMPVGCLFVIQPANEGEAKSARNSLLIENVDLAAAPERLVMIVTSKENVERIRGWMRESGMPEDKVVDFDTFVERCKSL